LAEKEPGLEPLPEDARLNSLDERLRRAKSEEAIRSGTADTKGGASYALGNRVLAELIGSMIGGAVIGGTLDWLLGTSPWLLLGLLFLGIQEHHQDFEPALEVTLRALWLMRRTSKRGG
jgi:ATP synthase protein I